MGFLNPLLLAGSLVLALPILVHLVRNDRSEIVRFSSLMFLLRIPKKAVRQQRLRNLLLMALRLLLIALLVMAFARPYFERTTTANPIGGQDDSLVLMLDNSYSMTYGTNFERMQNEARDRLAGLAAGARAGIVVFNRSSNAPVQITDDRDQLRAVIDSIEPSSDGTNYYEGFSSADRLLGQLEGTNRKLVVVSDFQRNGWNRPARESLIDSDVEVEFVDLGVENPANVAIETVKLDATVFSREYAGQLQAQLQNYGLADEATVNVVLEIAGREVQEQEVSIPADSSILVQFSGFELPLGYSEGRVRIETADQLAADNEWKFVVQRRDRMGLLIVDAGIANQSHFLEEAFASDTTLPFAVERVRYDAVTPARLESARVVIVNDVPGLSEAVSNKLAELRADGQGQMVIVAANADAEQWNSAGGLPAVLGEKVFVQRERNQPFYSLTRWDRNHEVFATLESGGRRFALNTVQFSAYVDLQPLEDSIVIAGLEDGSPMMVQSPSDRGRLIMFGSSIDRSAWNDLALKTPVYLPLMVETARYLGGYRDDLPFYRLGEAVPVPPGESAAVITPDGDRLSLSEGGTESRRYFTPEQTGVFELRVGSESIPVAVNSPAGESDLDPMPPVDLVASVRRDAGQFRSGALLTDTSDINFARRQNLWWYLFLFALLVGIGEIYLGNRLTENVRARPEVVSTP